MNIVEMLVFVAYFLFMLGIGVFFFLKSKDAGEKDYFLGGRNMGAWVSALSAGASDMSAWVLMGLPASIYAFGIGQTWIAIGLGIGYALSWIFEAPRLRRFSIVAKDSITIPQYLTARLLGPQLVAFAGSLTSLVYLLLWLRIFEHKTPGEHRRFGKEKEATHELGFLRAGSIYLVMFVLILAANPLFPKISGELAAVATPLSFTLDDGRVLTAKIDWIATPGVLILISTILGGLIQGAGPRIMGEAFARTAKQLAPAEVAICGIVAMATVMDVSGLIEKTAEPLIINICTK